MAFASVSTLGNNGATTNNQASLTITTSAALAVGDLAIIISAVDANATTDGDDLAVSGIAHAGSGQNWIKAAQFSNGQGSLGTGTSVSIWYRKITASIASGQAIVITYTSAPNSDETAASAWKFTMDTSMFPKLEGTATAANDAGATGSLNVTTPNIPCLRIRATSTESATATAWTATAGWTLMTLRGSGGATDAAQHIRGEFIISTATGAASNPTGGVNPADHASVYAAFSETPLNRDSFFFILQ